MLKRRYIILGLASGLALLVMGDVNLQTATTLPSTVDWGSAIQNLGQFGLLVWLIVQGENRRNLQNEAAREERKWLIGLLFGERSRTSDEEKS